MLKYAIICAFMAGAASAQEFTPRASDTVLSADAMAQDVVGRSHEFFDGGVSFFSISGSYSYTYPDGGTAFGTYTVEEGGVVCSAFNHGFSRCDMYVHDGTRLVLITADGARFPVRNSS